MRQIVIFMLVNSNTVKYNVIREKANITVCPKDKEAALQQLNAEKINVKDTMIKRLR